MSHHHDDDSSSFAQTGPEFTPSDASDFSDDDAADLRRQVGGAETHELVRKRETVDYTPDEELAVRTKFDRRLVLFVALLYMLSFLDRSNIGNARLAGMDDDLQSSPPNHSYYSWSLTAFHLSYILFEWLSLLWTVVPAHVLVSLVVLAWGLAASLQAVAVSYPTLIALRVLLGIGEAGFTGIPLFLSAFFKPRELAFRTAIFVSAAPLATSFSSSLAWLVLRLARFGPIAPWRLLFLLEGFPSVLAATFSWSVIPDAPHSASYLTPREREVAVLRLRAPTPDRPSPHRSSLASESAPSSSTLRSPVAWFPPVMLFLANMAYSSLPVFLPKIVADMGFSPLASQALCAPPYLLAFFLVLFTAHMSDRLAHRSLPLIAHALASAAGYGLLAIARVASLSAWLRYFAVYPAAIGFFNVVVLVIAWNINNQPQHGSHRARAFTLMQLIGQCGPLLGTRLYPDAHAPYYVPGMSACALAMLAVAVLAIILRSYLAYLNRKMDQAMYDDDDDDDYGDEESLNKRGRLDSFRYML